MWLFSSRKAQRTAPARRPSAYRPRLEALEDRCLLNAGFLDPTFGTAGAGLVTTAIASINNSGGQGLGQRALIQSDGKVLAIGGSTVRYNADGSLDSSFGSVGIANYSGNGGALLAHDVRDGVRSNPVAGCWKFTFKGIGTPTRLAALERLEAFLCEMEHGGVVCAPRA